jgi:hypothetical protein
MTRRNLLLGTALLFAVVALIRALWPDDTITVNFKNAPFSKVVAEIQRQGRVKIVSNVPPQTPVTLQLDHAPLLDALDTFSVRTETDLRPATIAAPDRGRTIEAITLFESGKKPENWTIVSPPGGFLPTSTTIIDVRKIPVALDQSTATDLHSSLKQIAMKSGLATAAPADWNPSVTPPKSPKAAADLARSIARSAKGQTVDVFLMLARGGTDRGDGPPRNAGGEGWNGGPRPGFDPASFAARAEAAIAQLPAEERPAALADLNAMQAVWKEVAALPEDQRREKMAEIFNRPEIQERMAEREAARDAKRTPEQRADRYKRYVQRKQAATRSK